MVALSYGVVQRPKPGNDICGDAFTIREEANRALVAVVDGLGSGEHASAAAERAIGVVEEHAMSPLVDIMASCDQALRNTRGAAVGLLAVYSEEKRLQFAGVGNVELRARRHCKIKPIPVNGIVGANYRAPKLFEYPYAEGEWLAIYTDGLRPRFDFDLELRRPFGSAQDLADRLAADHARENDDLTLVVLCLT